MFYRPSEEISKISGECNDRNSDCLTEHLMIHLVIY